MRSILGMSNGYVRACVSCHAVKKKRMFMVEKLITYFQVRDIIAYLESNDVVLPNGGHLTPRRFQQLGMDFGMSGE